MQSGWNKKTGRQTDQNLSQASNWHLEIKHDKSTKTTRGTIIWHWLSTWSSCTCEVMWCGSLWGWQVSWFPEKRRCAERSTRGGGLIIKTCRAHADYIRRLKLQKHIFDLVKMSQWFLMYMKTEKSWLKISTYSLQSIKDSLQRCPSDSLHLLRRKPFATTCLC